MTESICVNCKAKMEQEVVEQEPEPEVIVEPVEQEPEPEPNTIPTKKSRGRPKLFHTPEERRVRKSEYNKKYYSKIKKKST